MKSHIAALLLATSAVFPALAQTLAVKTSAPERYVVKKGDTLWDISSLYLNSPWKWPALWQWNPQIKNPHLIYPGDVLSLHYDSEGNPRLSLAKGVRRLSPQVRVVSDKNQAIPTLPLAVMEPFMRFEQALGAGDFAELPMVLGSNFNYKMNIEGHLLYVKGDLPRGGNYGIYRKGDAYRDPDNGAILAYESILVGTARVIRTGNIEAGEPSTVKIESVRREVKPSDVLMPISSGQTYSANFKMTQPMQAISGNIIASSNKLREFSTMAVVVIDLGRKDDLQEGNVLAIHRQSPTVIEKETGPSYIEDASSLDKVITEVSEWFGEDNDEDSVVWHMPKEKVGELMLFKVYDNISYAMVTKTRQPVRVGDSVSSR
ncbi:MULTISPECIES: LysM peptidoglycan-binding domain-containing protein [unclassified Pseudoalteromonas]|uniref:LysM peptidoglycan-binding domain-containing protein n=1 Tax=unclassified Pseudoalteromonas TaxID=194690 RepID=UPI0020969F65|nr:LysM peptidoglycan-binding domain-containing protein [Pseudoalteromonas sp. XMcav2-N]MCO7191273.1 LysM peptidoglycan-binding domain-containing protein [Pseudoalteromonas sp. XMcav2-N]